jgi:WD40 repeat protein
MAMPRRRKGTGLSYANGGYDFDGFISYKQGKSGEEAAYLQRSLQNFARPWHRARRALRIFLDLANLSFTPQAEIEMRGVLDRSAWLVLLATPVAAQSPWVKWEVKTWLDAARDDRLIIVRAGGEIEWNDRDGGFADQSTALPEILIERSRGWNKPIWVNLPAALPGKGTSRSAQRQAAKEWEQSVARLSATIHGWELDEVYGEHRRQRRIGRALIASAIVLVLTGAGVAGSEWWQKLQQRRAAQSREFAAAAVAVQNSDPALSRQLSVEAYHASPTVEARSVLLSTAALPRDTRILDHPKGGGWSIAGTRDGRTVATSGGDGSVSLWNLRQPERPERLSQLTVTTAAGVPEPVESVAFSPDDSSLAAADFDGRIWLWNIQDLQHPRSLSPPVSAGNARIGALSFSPDGRTLVTAGRDGTIRLWQVKPGAAGLTPGQRLTSASGGVASAAVAFAADGRNFATATGKTLQIWKPTGPATAQPIGGPAGTKSDTVEAIAFHPSKPVLSVGYENGGMQLWNLADPARPASLARVPDHRAAVAALSFSADGTRLLSGSDDASLTVRDLTSGVVLRTLPHPQAVRGALFLGSDDEVASVCADGYLRIWHLPGPVLTGEQSAIASVLFRPHAPGTLATGGDPNDFRLWNVADALHPRVASRPPTRHKNSVDRMAFRADGKLLAVPSDDKTIEIWDVSDPVNPHLVGEPILAHTAAITGVAFSPEGKLLASASSDRTARLWDLSNPARPQPLGNSLRPDVADPGAAASVTFSRDGTILAVGNGAGAVMLYDVTHPASPREIPDPLEAAGGPVLGLAWSPDDHTLATAGKNGQVTLWERVEPEKFVAYKARVMRSGAGSALSVTFLDNSRLAVGNEDGSTWIWDLKPAVPTVIAQLTGPLTEVFGLDYDTSRGLLASGAVNGVTVLWKLSPDAVIADICHVVGDPPSTSEWKSNVNDQAYRDPCAGFR